MTATYEKIATTTLGSTQTSTTFSSIASTYTDIVIVVNAKGASSADFGLRFNSDTGSNYSATGLDGTGSAASSWRRSNQTEMLLQNNVIITTGNFNFNSIISVQNYANATTYKTAVARVNNAESGTNASVGLWRSTSAINSITILATNTGFATGCTFTLYGIKAE